MCGYCIEGISFSVISNALSGQDIPALPEYIEAIGYLQEWPDLLSALAATPMDVVEDGHMPTIIVCRGLETLTAQGFASATYMALLENPAYIAALAKFTDQGGRERHHPAGPRFDISAAGWVHDRLTYTKAGHLDAQLQRLTLAEGQSLLRQYVDFRLKGIGLQRNDLVERLRQTGVLDPIEDICADDRAALVAHFPAFWCALHWLGRYPEGASYVWEVVTNDPIGVPDFEGLDLWLQRRAALLAYDRFGLAPFLENLSSVRADLFQFIGLMRQVSPEDQASLLTAMNRLEIPDHLGEHFSLRQWLEEGDLQVS